MTIQANQGFGVSVFGAVSSGGGGGTPGGLDTQVQFNSSGSFGASAALTFVSPALTIGTQQTTQGQIVFANTAAGAFATTVQSSNSASAAWTLTLPATAGTANYALTTNGSGVSSWSQISLTAGVTGTLPLANGGTNANLTASNGGVVYSGASAFAVLSGTATAGQMLRSGASGAPSWSTATFPSTATSTGTLLQADGTNWVATTATFPSTATSTGTILRADGTNWVATTATYPTTTTANQLLYSSATNTVGGLASANTSALVTNASGVPSFTSGTTANRVLRTNGTTVSFAQVGLTTDVTGVLPVANGGTNASSASITAFNNITGYTASGATGTTSTNLVFSTSPNITTPTFTTSATGPLFIGGSGTTSTLTLRSTSNVGTTGADIIFQTGNNGATEAMRILNNGNIGIFNSSPTFAIDIGTTSATGTATPDTVSLGVTFSNAAGANAKLRLFNSGALTYGLGVSSNQLDYMAPSAASHVWYVAGVESLRITSASNFQATGGGLIMPAQVAPTSKGAAATLTGAELITGLLQYTGAADTVTLPTGTNIEGALTWTANNVSLDWYVINTGSGTCTIGANGNTTVGTLTVTNGTSGHFRIRRTAANTFTVYRMA